MTPLATIQSLHRYPVKSMRGEEKNEAFLGFSGIYGDRIFAFTSSASPKAFPYLTAREQRNMLRNRPRFRFADKAARPINLAEAESLGPGVTPVFADAAELMVDVETPTGQTFSLDDPALRSILRDGVTGNPELTLIHSHRAMTDCRPVSLFSTQTLQTLGEAIKSHVDPRCFRANVYLDFHAANGCPENDLIGRSLRIGSKAVITILERDPRCIMITLDPDTAESNPQILKQVAQAHNGAAGVYAAVLVEGMVHKGDEVRLVD